MKRLVTIMIFIVSTTNCIYSQSSFTVDDLLALSSISSKKIDNFMVKRGFAPVTRSVGADLKATSFYEKKKTRKKDTLITPTRNIDLYKKGNTWFFALHTLSEDEYKNGQQSLKKAGFAGDASKKLEDTASGLFQKGNMLVETATRMDDGVPVYTFLLQKKELPTPDKIEYAEDLLVFDSHEYLTSFFGKNNVKKDLYYLSETELKSCSVIFGNTPRQAVFVWEDEKNMRTLTCILISDVMPTVEATNFNGMIHNNEWRLKTGVHAGMSLAELLLLNKKNFLFYGNRSKNEFSIEGENNGELDFSNNKIILGCNNCNGQNILNATSVSAIDAVRENMGLYVYYIMLFPKNEDIQAITRKN